MTDQEFLDKVDELLKKSFERARENARKVIATGCIDVAAEEEGTYRLVKDTLVALLKEGAWQWDCQGCSPSFVRKSRKNVRNILCHL